MNEHSSRSHTVFSLRISGTRNTVGQTQTLHGTLHLVDLAGSERLAKSNATGERLNETKAINKSLSALTDVFVAISKKQAHIPYRNSKLTFLLQPCLSGDVLVVCMTCVCVCVYVCVKLFLELLVCRFCLSGDVYVVCMTCMCVYVCVKLFVELLACRFCLSGDVYVVCVTCMCVYVCVKIFLELFVCRFCLSGDVYVVCMTFACVCVCEAFVELLTCRFCVCVFKSILSERF